MGNKARTKAKAKAASVTQQLQQVAKENLLDTISNDSENEEQQIQVDEDDESMDEEEQERLREEEIERQLVEEARAKEAQEKASDAPTAIYNKAAMLRLADEVVSQDLPWVETLDVCEFPLELVNAHDDLKREVAFYNNSLAAVKFAKDRLHEQKIPYKRPEDYFAEMLKSDVHMAKVKDKLIYEQKKIAAVDERKKSQAHKKVAKKIQGEKIKQRAQAKKDTLEAVKQWKKRSRNNVNGPEDEANLEQIIQSGNKRKLGGSDNHTRKTRKREMKDKKFGYGGKKRFAKSNEFKSTNDDSSFSRSRNNSDVGRASKRSKGNRPGKAAREKARASRK